MRGMSELVPTHPAERSEMLRACVHYRDGRRIGEIPVDDISEVLALQDNSFIWVGLNAPDAALLHKVQEEFGLHPLAIEDALKAHQRPKIEPYGDTLFLVLHTAQAVQGRIAFGESHVFVGAKFIITVRHGASLPYAAARERCEASPELLSHGPGFALYATLDFAVDNYFPIVADFQRELESLETSIFSRQFDHGTVHRLYDLKRDLTRMRLAVSPLQDLVNQLLRYHPHVVREELRVYFRDVHDHVVRVNEATDTLLDMLTAAMQVNLALVTAEQGEVVA